MPYVDLDPYTIPDAAKLSDGSYELEFEGYDSDGREVTVGVSIPAGTWEQFKTNIAAA
ncbi:hypothetical protein ACTMTF_15190 [Nonomuraea sp. ZG12]|uniref:hypothetical protein n=1 Tax=Nonomuraea sp. ZG12 TaxID=3452207 RepID=UPI003F89834F